LGFVGEGMRGCDFRFLERKLGKELPKGKKKK
jgi:hypothetical protein